MFVFVLLALVASAAAHKISGGGCPKVQPIEGFDMERFQGDWYVMSKLDADIDCVTNHFYAIPEAGIYNHTEKQEFKGMLLSKEVELRSDGNGFLKMDYPWPIPDAMFVVLDTDYENSATIFKCQSFPGFHRWSAAILSKDVNMNKTTINDHLKVLEDFVETTEMDYIDHSNCVTLEEAMFTLKIGPGISAKPGGQGIKSFIDGIKSFSEPLKMKGDEDNAEPETLFQKQKMEQNSEMDMDFF